jgi:hypothetical protein
MAKIAALDTIDPSTPMGKCLTKWFEVLSGDESAFDELIAEGAVLHSPVLFRPLPGKDTVIMYLTAASMSFVGDNSSKVDSAKPTHEHPNGGAWDGRFRYVRETIGEFDAVLEFETTMNGKYVNGVDMIRCNAAGQIVDFKVMVRPMQALDSVRELMVAALDTLK